MGEEGGPGKPFASPTKVPTAFGFDLTLAPHASKTVVFHGDQDILLSEIASLHAMHPATEEGTHRAHQILRVTKCQTLSNSYCARMTTLYAPTPTLALKFSPSFPPGLAVVSKLSPLMKLGS